MTSYSFDKMTGVVAPVYPKAYDANNDALYRLPPRNKFDRAVYNGEAIGVDNAPTDSSGVIFHSEVRNTEIDSSGRLSLVKKPDAPGLYQVSVMLSMPNNASVVPLDFILRVTESGGDNQYMPELSFSPGTIGVYPDTNTVYEGFDFTMALGGRDQQGRTTQPAGCTDVNTGCKIMSETLVGLPASCPG